MSCCYSCSSLRMADRTASLLSARRTRRLPSIRLNTVGYTPGASKRATIINADGAFVIRAADSGNEVMRGQLVPLDANGDRYSRPMIADFTDLDAEGDLSTRGARRPRVVRVSHWRTTCHNWPFYCAMRAMYLWRCGTAVSGEFDGDHFHHEACHLDDAYLDHVGGPAGKAAMARAGGTMRATTTNTR